MAAFAEDLEDWEAFLEGLTGGSRSLGLSELLSESLVVV